MAHTGAARAGVENLTKTLSQEWADYNIRINAVAPGTIESSGLEQYPDFIQSFFDKARDENLMKRFGTIEDVANAVIDWHGKGEIQYIPFPVHLKGAYQSYTQANIDQLRNAGYDAAFASVEQGTRKYLDWLNES